jgi:3-oxocholest-4-en-26-oate---CoA ligase
VDFNLYDVVAAVAESQPSREALVFGDRRLTAEEFLRGAHRFGNALLENGLAIRAERATLARHESGQPHVALYLRNCPEYLEGMVGCFAARAVPLNVNYRYLTDEVVGLFADSAVDAVVFGSEFAPVLSVALARLGTSGPRLVLQVPDGSPDELMPGARWYADVVGGASSDPPPTERSPDDLYGIYTGGTTGQPKMVLWRQADAFCPLFGGRRADGTEWESLDQIVVAATGGSRHMPVAPFMHAAGQWPALRSFVAGNTLVVPPLSAAFDPVSFLDLVEAEDVAFTNVVGDAFLWPIVHELRERPRPVAALKRISTGGTSASPRVRRALLELLPHVEVYETVGASETGAQLAHLSTADEPAIAGAFTLLPRACVLSEDRSRELHTDVPETGWIASRVRVPLGYLGDERKSAVTFPTIDDVRYSISGDRVVLRADGLVDMLGRDSGVINTGGEKVFAEEVERVLLTHPLARDVVVCGRPNERWGTEVVAVIAADSAVSDADLAAVVRSQLAAYKVPRAFLRVPEVRRGPNGKVDLAWARALAAQSAIH